MPCQRIKDGFICITSYGAFLDECRERIKRGEKQLFCPRCEKWVWPEECGHGEYLDMKGWKKWQREEKE
jgi:hypothetical protein